MIEMMEISMVFARYIQDCAASVHGDVWTHNEKKSELCQGSVNKVEKKKGRHQESYPRLHNAAAGEQRNGTQRTEIPVYCRIH